MDSKVEDFFKEIEALTVPDELIEKAYSNAAPPKEEVAEQPRINKNPAPQTQKPASSAIKNEPTCPWQEIHDDSTGYSYYWNMNTNEVTWDCPQEYTLYLQSTYKTEPTPKPTQAKKEASNPPVGSIIPISYYGNTSSSDEASDVEKDIQPPKKTEKPPKPAASKKSKQSKKHSKNKSNGHESPVIGPQLPPDFQFPVVAVKTLRPVVDYDSFSDEDEEPESPKLPPHAKTPPRETEFLPVPKKSEPVERRLPLFPIVSEPQPETPTLSFKDKSEQLSAVTSSKTEPKCDAPISEAKTEPQPEPPSLKRKAEVLCTKKETSLEQPPSKMKSLKKAKKSDVNIDKIFAAHSAYGKHGCGLGWQVQPENEGLFAEESEPPPRNPKGKFGKSPISFVKSSDILDLKALNQEDEEAAMEQSDKEEDDDPKSDASPKVQEVLGELEANKPDVESVSEGRELKDSETGDGSPEVKCEEEVTLSKVDEESGDDQQKEVKVVPLVKFALEDVEEDIDEIDRVLSEALEAKKAAKSLEKTSAAATSDLKMDADSTGKKPVKSPESGTESDSSNDKERETLAEQSSEVIEKLTFLLASNSTVTALNAFLVQMQTRIVDWQAKALDSNYFKCRLKEVRDYLDRYESSIISGDWMCKWDRENKRYFYLNKITQAAQWTYPEESSNSEASSPCNSPLNEFAAPPTHSAAPEPPSSTPPLKDSFVPSPPPPPPGVDSPPPPPPDEQPPSPPPERDPMDMDLDNSSDYTPPPPIIGRNGVEMDSSVPQVRESTFQNLGSPLARFADFKSLSSKPTVLDPTNEAPLKSSSVVPEETTKVADVTSAPQPDTSRSKTNKSSVSTKKDKKKKKLQLGIGLKKKNIPSLVEKWLKIKEEQEKEDKNSEVLRNEIM